MQVLHAVALVTFIIGGYNYGFRELELDIPLATLVVVDVARLLLRAPRGIEVVIFQIPLAVCGISEFIKGLEEFVSLFDRVRTIKVIYAIKRPSLKVLRVFVCRILKDEL